MTGVRREILAVGLASAGLAVVMTWPAARHPASTVPEDLADPLLQVWLTSWGGHALRTQPLHVFDTNAFWPLKNSLAFSESFLGYAPFGLVGSGPTAGLVRYNVLYVLAFALAFAGAYALARQLGTSPLAAAVAGAAFAYAPWRIAQSGHLHILSSGGIPLALALLARGHGYARAGPRPWRGRWAYAAAGWAVAAWQLTIGFGLGLPFAYLLALVVAVAVLGWLRAGRPVLPRRLVVTDALGLAAFVLIGVLLARPYLAVVHEHPEARRGEASVALFSPPLRGFLTTPEQDALWGPHQREARAALPFPAEMTLAPGATVAVLAVVGVLAGRWSRRRRLALAAAVLVGVVLAMGTRFPGGGRFTYLVLLHHAPGWEALRTPGRLVVFVTLALGLLAAAGLDAVARIHGRAGRLVPALAVAAVLAEGVSTIPHPRPEPLPPALRGVQGPVLTLPSDDYNDDAAMFWSTAGFPPLVNGSSGFTPSSLADLRQRTTGFPDPVSVELLRQRGVRTVVVLRNRIPGTPWQLAADKPVAGLALSRSERGGAVVFRLAPAPR